MVDVQDALDPSPATPPLAPVNQAAPGVEDLMSGDTNLVDRASTASRPPPEVSKASAMRIAQPQPQPRPQPADQNPLAPVAKVAGDIGKGVTDTGQKAGGWFGENRNWIIPLLTGIGGMASSNSRYLGSAILQGLGAGAQSYGQEQQAEANLSQTQAQNRGLGIHNTGMALEVAKKGFWTDDDGNGWVFPTKGGRMSKQKWMQDARNGHVEPVVGEEALRAEAGLAGGARGPQTEVPGGTVLPASGAPHAAPTPGAPMAPHAAEAPGAPTAPQPGGAGPAGSDGDSIFPAQVPTHPKTDAELASSLGDKGAQLQDETYQQHSSMPNAYLPNSAARKDSDTMASVVKHEADLARGQRFSQQQLTDEILKLPDGSPLQGGPLNPVVRAVAGYYNNALGFLNLTPAQLKAAQINPEDLKNGTAADKLTGQMAFLTSHGFDQRSLGGLTSALGISPGTQMNKESAIAVLAGLASVQQRAIDRHSYLNDWNGRVSQKYGNSRFTTSQDAMDAFEAEHGAQYGKEKAAYERALRAKHNQTKTHLFNDIYAGKLDPSGVDEKFKTGDKPTRGLSRWFSTR